MARKITEVLIDDLDGTEASETVRFTVGGRSYEIDLSTKNAAKLDKILTPYKARRAGGRAGGRSNGRRTASAGTASTRTLFSTLEDDAKDAFRKWAKMPSARRIADHRVQAWIDAGTPSGVRAPAKKTAAKKAAGRKRPAKRTAAPKQK